MSRFQFAIRTLSAGVAAWIIAVLLTIRPSWQLGLLQSFLVLAAAACSLVAVIQSAGIRRSFFLGVSVPTAISALLFLERLSAECCEVGDENVYIDEGLAAVTPFFKIVLMLWGISPVVGILCVLMHWFWVRPHQLPGAKAGSFTDRRRIQFSLRTFFVLITALAVWLGLIVVRIREQREAVRQVERIGGRVIYDWQQPGRLNRKPNGPEWLRRVIGDDYFQTVEGVYGLGSDADAVKAIPYLQQLPALKTITFPYAAYSKGTLDELRAALPSCNFVGVGP